MPKSGAFFAIADLHIRISPELEEKGNARMSVAESLCRYVLLNCRITVGPIQAKDKSYRAPRRRAFMAP
jgi:hypothetical protein